LWYRSFIVKSYSVFRFPLQAGFADPVTHEPMAPQPLHTVKVYTREAVLLCLVHSRQCMGGCCILLYTGQEHCLFFNKQSYCIAEEVMWDFVGAVKRTKISFTGFCTEMSNKYSTTHPLSSTFLSRQTFLAAFFAWVVSFDLDFRKDGLDPWCAHCPKQLVGDGTHIGAAVRHATYKPIERPDTDEVVQPRHKRFQRVFMPTPKRVGRLGRDEPKHKDIQKARKFLKRHCQRLQGVLVVEDEQEDGRENFNWVINSYGHQELVDFCQAFLNEGLPDTVTTAAVPLMVLLLTDGALSSIFPFRYHKLIHDTLHSLCSGK